MSATSPSPNSPPTSATSPPSPSPPLPSSSSPPPSSQPNANPPETSNSTTNSPPPQPSPPPPTAPLPPPPVTLSPPPPVASPPNPPPPNPQSPPPASPPTPLTSGSPPPPSSTPPPPSNPPTASPPPPLLSPPDNSPPPPPPPRAPQSSPPPPVTTTPPQSSPSPPPPRPVAPTRSPPSPPPPPPIKPIAPENPTPPAALPPGDAPPPPRRPPSNPTLPPGNSPPESSPSPPVIRLSPPPPSHVSPAPPSLVPTSLSGNETGSANSNGSGGIGTVGGVAIAVVASILMLSLVGLLFWCVRKRRKKILGLTGHVMPSPMVSSSSPNSDSAFLKANSTVPLIGSGSGSDFGNSPRDPAGLGNSHPWFGFEELSRATNGFSEENLLGEGGFGSVYKGYLPDGREIAVKQLKIGGGQGEREFKAEVEIISRIHHRHLVSLVGYCIADTRRLLVYDYVPNNNLYHHLHGEGLPVLDWEIRVKIAAGAARGLAYLHEDCHPRIIHRDIKSSNILLDNNFEARVSDFGLAKLALEADTHITTRVMGTFGYVAPEYASSGKLTDKSDVYSFGVVLLELITGRKPVDASQPLGDESLVEWARPLLSHAIENGEYDSLVDPKLEKNYVEAEMFRMIEISASCVRHSSAKRPRMGQVVRAFESLGTTDLTNGMRVGESEVFNSAQQSEEIRWFQRMAFGSQDFSTDFFSQASLNSRENRENNV